MHPLLCVANVRLGHVIRMLLWFHQNACGALEGEAPTVTVPLQQIHPDSYAVNDGASAAPSRSRFCSAEQ